MWDLGPGIEPGYPALGARSLSREATKEVPLPSLLNGECVVCFPAPFFVPPLYVGSG